MLNKLRDQYRSFRGSRTLGLLEALRDLVKNALDSALRSCGITLQVCLIIAATISLAFLELLILAKRAVRHLWRLVRTLLRFFRRGLVAVIGFLSKQWHLVKNQGKEVTSGLGTLLAWILSRARRRLDLLIEEGQMQNDEARKPDIGVLVLDFFTWLLFLGRAVLLTSLPPAALVLLTLSALRAV